MAVPTLPFLCVHNDRDKTYSIVLYGCHMCCMICSVSADWQHVILEVRAAQGTLHDMSFHTLLIVLTENKMCRVECPKNLCTKKGMQ